MVGKKSQAEIVAEITASEPNLLTPEEIAKIEAIPEEVDYPAYVHGTLYNCLCNRFKGEVSPENVFFDAEVQHATHELLYLAALVTRAKEKLLGNEISPAKFAIIAYSMAETVLKHPSLDEKADNVAEEMWTPRKPLRRTQKQIERDEAREALRREIQNKILTYLSARSKPISTAEVREHILNNEVTGRGAKKLYGYALRDLVEEGKVRRKGGWFIDNDSIWDGIKSGTSEHIMIKESETPLRLVVEETIGEGDELVYVYFNEADRELAKHEKRDWWPCKVGFTAKNLTERLLAQCPSTSRATVPVVGLVIKTDDARELERTLHSSLKACATEVEESMGAEWFQTSPDRIKNWYLKYLEFLEAAEVFRR